LEAAAVEAARWAAEATAAVEATWEAEAAVEEAT
jgi:hypothetical protein